MPHLLQINSSLFGENGNSSLLSLEFVQRWKTQNPGGTVTLRDLASETVAHLDSTRLAALLSPAQGRTAAQQAVIDYSDQIIAEIQAADAIVIGVPLYNFGVPSTLKAYFDHAARAGVSFKYSDAGPVGLLDDKPVYIIATRGGMHKGLASDSQTQFLTTFLNFLGLHSIQFIYAEGLNMSVKEQAFEQAKNAIEQEMAA